MADAGLPIDVEALRFAYPQAPSVLAIPHLSIAAGERVAVIGPSGSGKTTFLHLLAGVLVPSTGTLRAGEVDVSKLDDAARRRFRLARVGLVFQELELLEHLSARENALLPALLAAGRSGVRAHERRLGELAERVGITSLLARPPRRLSQGERQRAAVCRALVCAPSLVLADEPTGNLDAATASTVVELLLSDATARRATLVVVTHDASALARFDRVLDAREWRP